MMFEFHISRSARDRYQFKDSLFEFNGNVIIADFYAAREFAEKMNNQRDLLRHPERAIKASHLNAMGLIDEVLHLVVSLFRQQVDPQVMARAFSQIEANIGAHQLRDALLKFIEIFPPLVVYQGQKNADDYYHGQSKAIPNRQIVLEEMLLLWLANNNPAFSPFFELFDDSVLIKDSTYTRVIQNLDSFFQEEPRFGPQAQYLVQMLQSPAIASPHSLQGQIDYIIKNWGALLGEYLLRLLSSLDFIKEEQKAVFVGPGPILPYDFHGLEGALERFSEDKDWMSHLVLLAKNVYVWLGQLQKKYHHEIKRLDQIPDQELDVLAQRGFKGLWLIGVWQRSLASQRIKQMMGNPVAIASAYSLHEYRIADDLGGEAAMDNLRWRSWQRGIRLASDMVPNHMGIDSRWVIEHPDWFLGLDHSPFPGYSFNGPNLMEHDSRVGVYLEDHYYDRSDAAVVFKRVDFHTGDQRYIYHGNDGTSMPWNDTAQLNFLKPEVREAVIQTILQVARQFPIIRFDAAMTLAKEHIQRLWYPEPGSGGDIPSRAQYGLSKSEFNRLLPKEFWQEVVDRVAEEVPETLLLAEAFWMMEGYFVRTLGMHRVYNSAFMHMLRDEDNAKYRQVIKNTLEFNPQILKRYVNFMNNPDEETAVEQFGKGDKYFGVCTMMATMPGLPMFGHGQVEGYAEKYGMEYQRALWDEMPDMVLVERHEQQIFPLLHRRKLFAEVDDYLLYDFFTAAGEVNEDVFAFSNRWQDERALVIYHNRYKDTSGWIKRSAAYSILGDQKGERQLVQRTLGEGLALPDHSNAFFIFRDHVDGLEYIRSCREIHNEGLYVSLGAYRSHVFIDFRVVYDSPEQPYARLVSQLHGNGVPDIHLVMREMQLSAVLYPYSELVNAGMFNFLLESGATQDVVRQVKNKYSRLLEGVQKQTNCEAKTEPLIKDVVAGLKTWFRLLEMTQRYPVKSLRGYKNGADRLAKGLSQHPERWGVIFGWLFTQGLGRVVRKKGYQQLSRDWMDEWLLVRRLSTAFEGMGHDSQKVWFRTELVKLLVSTPLAEECYQKTPAELVESWFSNAELQTWLRVNRFQDVLWFNKEAFDEWLWWALSMSAFAISSDKRNSAEEVPEKLMSVVRKLDKVRKASEGSDYQVEKLLLLLRSA